MIGDEVDPSVISIPEWIKLPRYFFMDPQIELSPNPNFSSRWIRESSCPARPCNTVSDTGSSAIPRPGQQSNLTSTSYYLDILGPITSVFSRNIYIYMYIYNITYFGLFWHWIMDDGAHTSAQPLVQPHHIARCTMWIQHSMVDLQARVKLPENSSFPTKKIHGP